MQNLYRLLDSILFINSGLFNRESQIYLSSWIWHKLRNTNKTITKKSSKNNTDFDHSTKSFDIITEIYKNNHKFKNNNCMTSYLKFIIKWTGEYLMKQCFNKKTLFNDNFNLMNESSEPLVGDWNSSPFLVKE